MEYENKTRNGKESEQIIGEKFLKNNSALSSLELPNLKKVDDDFLYDNTLLSENLNLPEIDLQQTPSEERHIGRGRR